MNVDNIIKEVISEMMSENKIWYHGTPDVRELSQTGSFSPRMGSTDYISDPEKWEQLQSQMKDARLKDEDLYFNLLDQAGDLRKTMSYKKPIFFTANRSVANTYAEPQRAFDYQNSVPKTLQVEINNNGNILQVAAHGERFRGIRVDAVRQGLNKSGVSDEELNKYLKMYPTEVRNDRMSAETLGIIAQQLGFDIVDVLGVLDSYHGGSVKSTVRMVFDPSRIKIINNGTQSINENVISNLNFSETSDEDRTIITAYNNGNIVGKISSDMLFDGYGYEFDDVFSEEEFDEIYPDDLIVKIESVDVEDNFKSQGIGSILMSKMMDLMRNRGYSQFYLNASPMGFGGLSLYELVDFYKKFGFRELKNQGNNVLMGVTF